MAGIRATGRTQPACPARCSERILQGRAPEVEDAAAAPATSSGRDRTRILTPDSSSPCESTPCGWKYSRLGRCCSGSLDRLVLGHLCTDRPGNTRNGIARARGRMIGHGSWAAGHGQWTWGTAAKQQHVSHAHLGRAPAGQKTRHRTADKAQWRPLDARCSSCCAASVPCADHLE